MADDDSVQALRQALQISPENLPLRQLLADTLLKLGRAAEAEQEYRQALTLSAKDVQLRLGLAGAFYQQGKDSQALVVVESLLEGGEAPARAYLLYARLLLRAGEVARGVRYYRKAVEGDPSLADPELAERLGIRPGSAPDDFASDDFVVDGKVRAAWDHALVPPDSSLERPAITFRDAGGLDGLKDEIRMKIIHPLTHPELYRAYGKAIGGGILQGGVYDDIVKYLKM